MLRRIPYGETDFVTIRKENSYYVDKTAFIPYFENAAKYIMFLRPRRFGKTLFINTLAAYYDVLEKDNFDQTFGGLYIHEHATGQQGKYMILKFSFASVDSRRENVEDSFNFTVCEIIKRFIKRYKNYLPENAAEYMSDVKDVSNKALSKLLTLTSDSPYKIYIMIDEYDNFANTLFSSDEDAYKVLTHGDGFFRLFFNVLKDMTSENNALIGRIFISGVSPLTLSDVTSGFNIALNLSIDSNLNDAMGFAESDVREMLEYYQNETGVFKHSIDQLVEIMKPNYNNYCFSIESVFEERVFNSDMVLYFVQKYISSKGKIPEKLIDPNVSTDFFKMEKMVKLEQTFGEKSRIILQIINEGKTNFELNPEFAVAEVSKPSNIKSLLFYMGLLSYGLDTNGYPTFIVPNDTVRQQYCRYMVDCYSQNLGWRSDTETLDVLWTKLAFEGDCKPFISYIASVMGDNSAVRDYDAQGEFFVKGFLLSHFCKNSGYQAFTELEANHGFTDLYLEPLGWKRHAYMIELKYCNKNAPDSKVKELKNAAQSQLQRYIADHRLQEKCADRKWELHTAVVVFRGWNLEVLE